MTSGQENRTGRHCHLSCLSSVFLMILTIIFDDRSSSYGRRSHLVSTYKSHLPTTIGGIRTVLLFVGGRGGLAPQASL